MGLRYLGGKDEALRLGLREQLITRARAHARGTNRGVRFFDLFCGSGKVTLAMEGLHAARFAADASAPVVCLLRALRDGWSPPEALSYDLWRALRQQAKAVGLLGVNARAIECDPIIAFAGFACSRNGAFFRGFQYDPATVAAAARSALKLGEDLRRLNISIQLADYRMAFRDVVGVEDSTTAFGPGDVVYCDIPYDGTATYATAPKFNACAFWRWAVRVARRGALVLVSEYGAPPVGVEVWRCARTVRVRRLNVGRKGAPTVIEKLYEVVA